MLYARCGMCGGIAPLWCSGQFMPHVPAYVAATPTGAYCSVCGPMPSIFTCMACGTRQFLVLPGAPVPAPAFPGASQNFAAVVQAEPGASTSTLNNAFGKFLSSAGAAVGEQAAQAMFGQQ
jgi:hypothetical protein